jgi:hypothetical protein
MKTGAESPAPRDRDGFQAQRPTRGLGLSRGRTEHGIGGGVSGAPRRAPIESDYRAGEALFLEPEALGLEVGAVAQHREEQPAQTVRDGDRCELVPPPRAEWREIRVERMVGAAGMMVLLLEVPARDPPRSRRRERQHPDGVDEAERRPVGMALLVVAEAALDGLVRVYGAPKSNSRSKQNQRSSPGRRSQAPPKQNYLPLVRGPSISVCSPAWCCHPA